ncbi:chaperonin GroEL [Nitrospirillum viridazoti]|uniref:Chaperonin GroEL n=2 Tax=Nitrospirillum TaxID=1543705 RepID=A0A248K118_9PROT|nr:chaperonin GroEL [Nitrospirillum amazonense]ASG24489.1 molecular chaperone GroEL [Nitrospirillum amazonense CBAmc]EGY01162.1 chaperonin GroEL [Nitrospirillum amazonense Y2]TWB37167.1 thermosome subunit [Nitrospirillum amazonense]TWB47676.1 thermosome subunit [Nitrospirillum amazonense]
MSHTDLRFGDEARAQLLHGADVLARAVKATLGPKGRTVLIKQGFGPARVTNDGVTVARAITLPGVFENMGAEMVREVAAKTGDEVGDGTTTATVLAQAILHEGVKAIAAGLNPMDLKRGIDLATAAAVADIKKRAKPVDTQEEIVQVGTVSANGDRVIGQLVADAIARVGREGAITIEDAQSLDTALDAVEGLQFDQGYISPYFMTDPEKMTCTLEEPYLLLHEKRLAGIQQLVPLLEEVMKAGRSLLIVAEDVEQDVLATLVVNRLRGGLRVAAVKAPGYGDRRRAQLEDIAIVTGGQVISGDLGMNLDSVTLAMLGRARRVVITQKETTIIDGAGAEAAIEARCAQLRDQVATATSTYDKDKLKERLAKLSGGVAVIRVGGATELEVKERHDRVDDAVHATRAAVAEGIVAGGGVALLYATRALSALDTENQDQRVGVDIVRRALERPIRDIAGNAGTDGAVVVGRLLAAGSPNFGYDAQRGQYTDLMAAGIIDPVKVVRLALQDAASVAGLLITTEVLVGEVGDSAHDHPPTDF